MRTGFRLQNLTLEHRSALRLLSDSDELQLVCRSCAAGAIEQPGLAASHSMDCKSQVLQLCQFSVSSYFALVMYYLALLSMLLEVSSAV